MNSVHTGGTEAQQGGDLGGEKVANGNKSYTEDNEVTTLSNFTISTLNVNSLYKSKNINLVMNEKNLRRDKKIKILKYEILVNEIINNSCVTILTDTRTSKQDIIDLKSQLKKTHIVLGTEHKGNRGGIVILIDKKTNMKINYSKTLNGPNNEGPRALFVKTTTQDSKTIRICGVYTSPDRKTESMREIDSFIQSSFTEAKTNTKIIAGDLNFDSDQERKCEIKTREVFKNILRKNNVFDSIDRARKTKDRCYTYNGGQDKNPSRIDYILISNKYKESISSYELIMGQRLNSDHNKTIININMKKTKKHSPMKFRADFLKDEGFKSLVKEEINKEILEMCRETKFNNNMTIDDLLYSNIDKQNLNIETLYDIIENTYFKVSKNRQRNKVASQNKILNQLNRRYFKLLNEKKQNTDEIKKSINAYLNYTI